MLLMQLLSRGQKAWLAKKLLFILKRVKQNMPESLDIKRVVDDAISSYEAKAEKMSSLFDTLQLILGGFQDSFIEGKEEREKINAQLRDILAKNEHLRRKDFDNMMRSIFTTQEEKEKEVKDLLKSYINEQRQMPQTLRESLKDYRDSLAKGEVRRLKEFQDTIREILAKQEKRKQEVTSKLKEFQREQKNLAEKLKNLLAKGRELRIKDLKLMLKEFRDQQEKRLASKKRRKEEAERRKEEVARMLTGFRKKRQGVSHEAIHPAPSVKKNFLKAKGTGLT